MRLDDDEMRLELADRQVRWARRAMIAALCSVVASVAVLVAIVLQ